MAAHTSRRSINSNSELISAFTRRKVTAAAAKTVRSRPLNNTFSHLNVFAEPLKPAAAADETSMSVAHTVFKSKHFRTQKGLFISFYFLLRSITFRRPLAGYSIVVNQGSIW